MCVCVMLNCLLMRALVYLYLSFKPGTRGLLVWSKQLMSPIQDQQLTVRLVGVVLSQLSSSWIINPFVSEKPDIQQVT